MSKFIDLTGKKFGRLIVVNKVANKGRNIMWECLCDCGEVTFVSSTHLLHAGTKSCGCYMREEVGRRMYKHGGSTTKLYKVWQSMLERCRNKSCHSFGYYGGRGIKVQESWVTDFKIFKSWAESNGYKEGLQIDRENNEGNYSSDNCRFVTPYVNSHNTRDKKKSNLSGYPGVWWSKRLQKWSVTIGAANLGKKQFYLGSFNNIKEAVEVRNNFIRKYNLPHKIQEVK